MSLLNTPIYRPLADGNYKATIVGYREVEAIDKLGKSINYVSLTCQVGTRTVSFNDFEKGIKVHARQLQDQLNVPEGASIAEILNAAIGKPVDFSKSTNGRYINYNFATREVAEVTVCASEDEDLGDM